MSPTSIPTIGLNRRQRRLLASGRARIYNDAGGTGIAIPDTADGLTELLNDETKLTEVINGGKLPDLVKAYAEQHATKDPNFKDQVRDEAQRVLADMLREGDLDIDARPDLRNKLPDPYSDPKNAAYHPQGLYAAHALGAQVDDVFATSGEYFHTIWRNNPAKNTSDTQAKLERLRNFSSDVPSDGGYLIPERLRSELLRVALETAVVRPRARVVPMETLRVPFPAIDSTSNVNSVYGGIVGYWTEEGGQLTESKPKFKRVVLDAKKLTAYTEVPSELLADSIISLTGFIDQFFPEALGFFEDVAFLTGDGVGKPLGALNGAAAIEVAAEGSQPANSVVWENIVKMYSRMLPSSLQRAVWVVAPDVFPELATMALSVGTGGSAIWLNNGQVGPPMTILGRPVITSEKVPSLGSAGDISFIDFGFYLVGDRQAMQARQSDDFKFDTDEVAFRIVERVDGRPWLQSAITPANGGSSLSPIVKLAART